MRNLSFLGLLAVLVMGPAQAATALIGNCEMTGTKGDTPVAQAAKPGQITVGVSLPAPLWWNGDGPNTIKDGFEYCLAADIAWHAGFDKIEIVNVDWRPLVAGETKSFDFALSEIQPDDERRKTADFSPPYFGVGLGVLVKKGTTFDVVAIKGWRVGVLKGSGAAQFVDRTLKPKSISPFSEPGDLFASLRAGQIDAAVASTPVVLAEAALEKGATEVAGQFKTGEAFAALYPKGSANAAAFDKILAALDADGSLRALAAKYLAPAWGQDPGSVPYLSP